MAKYNPVTNPNPDNAPGRLPVRVMSQGTTGNIAQNLTGEKHILTADPGIYGEQGDHGDDCGCPVCN